MGMIPDAELIKRVVKKDEQAFLGLYDRYSARVFALTLRVLRDEQLAEDATQETFLKCWNRIQSFLTQKGAFGPWLLTIARNTALDKLRMDKRRPLVFDEQDPEEVWELISAEGSETDEGRWRSLYLLLQSLPNENRVVIELAYYQGLSHSEIAETLGWPVGTVKTRIRLGMDQLRQQWLDEETVQRKTKPSFPGVSLI